MLEQKLDSIRKFQIRFPSTHVGGSIGLFLHGINLCRSLDKSDIDLTSSVALSFEQPLDIENAEESSNPEEFDYQFRIYPAGYDHPYTKVDINVKPDKEYDLIERDGFIYKVSKLADIYFWKSSYAAKGVEKHIDDFIAIVTGIRPVREKKEELIKTTHTEIDDLPF